MQDIIVGVVGTINDAITFPTLLVTLLGSIVLLADIQGRPSPLIGKVSL